MHFPGNLGRILVRIKAGNLVDARHSLTELFPDGINGDAQGGNSPESSDHHTSLHGLLSLHYFLGWPSRTIQAVDVECENEYDVQTCSLYIDSTQQYSMGVTRHQQTLAEKGLHMGPHLTLVRVEQCLQQGKSEAERLGVQAAIVVVDAAGHLMGALRFEEALWVTPEIARAKANAAVAFRASTAALEERWRERLLFATSVVNLSPGQFVIGTGAVPIVIDGTVVGAVGVSGGIPADLDHAIAEAAVRPG